MKAPVKAQMPPVMCTTPEPAKSTMPADGAGRGGGVGWHCLREGGERGTSEHRVLVEGGEEAVFVPHPAAREKGVTAVQTSATPPGVCSPSPGLAPGLGA